MKTLKIITASFLLACAMLSFVPVGEWIMITTNNCKIYFPKKPTDRSGTVNTAKGNLKVNIYSYQAAANVSDDNLAYILTETEYPDSVINSDDEDKLDIFFKNSIDGIVNNFHGTLLSQSKTAIDGFPGRQVKLDLQQGKAVMNIRFYLVKNRMYILEIITNTNKDGNAAIEKFMNSFEIKN
ncbi:MAG: hypothetical protein Q8891_02110 [Bacteroidota bacterium]|jgi:hypothetical protein|nr:hypothetical protein [Bacteroidota bacterium]